MMAYHVDGFSERKFNSRHNTNEVKAIILWLNMHKGDIEKAYNVDSIESVLGIITPFASQKTALYRSSQSVPFPVIDFPTDNNHIMARLDSSPESDANLDYFGMGPSGNIEPYRRTYMLNGILTSGAGNSVSLGQVSAVQSGTYLVKLTVGKSNNQSPTDVGAIIEEIQTFYVDSFGNQPQALITGKVNVSSRKQVIWLRISLLFAMISSAMGIFFSFEMMPPFALCGIIILLLLFRLTYKFEDIVKINRESPGPHD